MAENTKIEWCNATFNPWIGCSKVSDGCKNCYAETLMDKRYGRVEWGQAGVRQRTSANYWKKPHQWNKQQWKQCSDCGWRGDVRPIVVPGGCPSCRNWNLKNARQRVFCASLADIFEDKPDQPELEEWRFDLFNLIVETPNLDWLLLTKRPENINPMIELATGFSDAGMWFHAARNVWVGTSVEDQATANERIPELLKVSARVRFLSCEPLLGPIDIPLFKCTECNQPTTQDASEEWGHRCAIGWDNVPAGTGKCESYLRQGIHWVIAGGESGPSARHLPPKWVRVLRNQCVETDTPFFFKQWGEWLPTEPDIELDRLGIDTTASFSKVGKKAAGRHLDGELWSQFPGVGAER